MFTCYRLLRKVTLMIQTLPLKQIAAFIIGLAVGGVAAFLILGQRAEDGHFHTHEHDEVAGAYHVHAGFLVMVDGMKISFASDDYMSTAKKLLHTGVHLHDNNDSIIHFHARDITLVDFLTSLSIDLTEDCLAIQKTKSCTAADKVLRLYINNVDKTKGLLEYVPQDNDRILLYYGEPGSPTIETYQNEVSDRACIYTGTCPERGTAPAEDCGLTCDL